MTERWSDADLATALTNPHLRVSRPPGRSPAPPPDKGRAATPQGVGAGTAAGAAPRGGSKYGNRVTVGPNGQGGERPYSSKREAKHAAALTEDKRSGAIADFFPQVALEIGRDEDGAAVRAVIDFLVIEEWLPDGRFVARLDDPKGADTLLSKTKRAALDARGMSVRLI